MRILVTGATGFVGAHTAAALTRDGHQVRALVRSPERLPTALGPLGVTGIEHLTGDCRDPVAVDAALEGCDAVVSVATVFTWAAREQRHLVETNRALAEVVLTRAVERGLDPVVHVSSYVALDLRHGPIGEQSPVASSKVGYSASKAAQEMIARRLQDDGAPVVIVYPGAVLGPHDPYLGESNALALSLVQPRRPQVLPGTLPCVDVRDVAAIHAAVLEPGGGPRRFMATGHDLDLDQLARGLAEAAGLPIRPVHVPRWAFRAVGRGMDLVAALTPLAPSGSSHAVEVVLGHAGVASNRAAVELGVGYRRLEETLGDTVAWLREAGHLTRTPDRAHRLVRARTS
ncbi:SDR family NAD(P)-dependent oxidoreductase [Egicoccus sp. AB-alg6-2]|uniref:SDR family NAD(P)-dependent oxidoreductase n=1 Tax=Egicoccus sp. AB-alg6-2 TaxID=3242692 RepID=UPI00359E67B2